MPEGRKIRNSAFVEPDSRSLPGGPAGLRFALYAVPFDHADSETIRLVAEDDAGNRAKQAFINRLVERPASSDTLQLDDRFLERVVPEVLSRSGMPDSGDRLADYLEINGDLRARNAARLSELAGTSAPAPLWRQTFVPLPNAKVMSPFAGNAVVVDHGAGLMSLYGHLSSLAVAEGETVARGQTVGRTGVTGLAGGDHLHFTMLVGGVPVDAREWWDPRWIETRVAGRLGAGFPFSR